MSTTTSFRNYRNGPGGTRLDARGRRAGIGVTIEDGVVSPSGEVEGHAEKLATRRDALRASGVVAVVDHLVVHPKPNTSDSDMDTVWLVAHALTGPSSFPDTVRAEIDLHRLALTGETDRNHQRRAVERAVRPLEGVVSVRITIKPFSQRPRP